ncbi:MAG: LysR family transcriptional regulator [Myxococcales bacterium]|mgnify:CR=1 FL=1|nr:LysR family transcriptional regulator [Myxococcales bacterium]
MLASYGRDLDLNLLRVFVAVADAGSVTGAASRLYLTQPAVSAALRRLTTAVGAPLLVRQGRGVVLSRRGERMLAEVRPHLQALLAAALAPPRFCAADSTHVVRLGMADSVESWLLPALLGELAKRAPAMTVVVVPVQFRTVAEALTTGKVEVAVSVVDEVPATVMSERLFSGSFVCLYDPRRVRLPRPLTVERYFAQDHVIVSYNADLRGIVEDVTGRTRRVRCALASFGSLGEVLDGSGLLATVPAAVAERLRKTRPHLRVVGLPFELPATPISLLWPAAMDGDEACGFVRQVLRQVVVKSSVARARPAAGSRLAARTR